MLGSACFEVSVPMDLMVSFNNEVPLLRYSACFEVSVPMGPMGSFDSEVPLFRLLRGFSSDGFDGFV